MDKPSESKLSLNAAKAEDHEFDLSLITSSKDKKNNIYLCIKGSFPKEEIRDRIDFLVSPGLGIIDFCTFSFLLHNRKDGFHLSPNG